ncbi:hypothetical protein N657DRAFT_476016 [Parathielavia appendiculata]|uniref:Uncharacterized protein n=1 Tax=Parathielavia appendiculata TaxID=2587402 RepID=A0AAN6TXS0_9PEZI|nr:hypothetical protein N657DRAFT_476016 [Parathielavia appendiculata]
MPPKRKAKGSASPARRTGRTSKTSPATDEHESDTITAGPTKRAREASSRAAKQNADSDDDDFGTYGRASLKPATIEQHLMDQNKKSKAFIQGFKEQVAQARDQLHEILARLKQDLCVPRAPLSYQTSLSPDIFDVLITDRRT